MAKAIQFYITSVFVVIPSPADIGKNIHIAHQYIGTPLKCIFLLVHALSLMLHN